MKFIIVIIIGSDLCLLKWQYISLQLQVQFDVTIRKPYDQCLCSQFQVLNEWLWRSWSQLLSVCWACYSSLQHSRNSTIIYGWKAASLASFCQLASSSGEVKRLHLVLSYMTLLGHSEVKQLVLSLSASFVSMFELMFSQVNRIS